MTEKIFEGNDLSELCNNCFDTKGAHISSWGIMVGRTKLQECGICDCSKFESSGKRLLYVGNFISGVKKVLCPFCKTDITSEVVFKNHKIKHRAEIK